jgi:hypothetical protein
MRTDRTQYLAESARSSMKPAIFDGEDDELVAGVSPLTDQGPEALRVLA